MKVLKKPFLLIIILCFVAINIRWLWLYRHGQLLDIDEAGYLGLSLKYYYNLVNDGLIGWIRIIEAPSNQAPLTMVLSSLCYCFFGPHVIVGFAVPLLAGAATVAATYCLGESLGSRRIGVLSAILAAFCPIIVNYSRSYHFAMPATAVTTLTLLSLLRTDRFVNLGWSTVFGVCLGLMPLARTMTIAFLPGIVLGAAVYAIVIPTDRRRRLLVLAWSLFLAAVTAATWLAPNGAYVFPYLFSFGYGARSAEYGALVSFFSLDKWIYMSRLFFDYLYLPHILITLAGASALLFITVRYFTLNGFGSFTRDVLNSNALPILIFIAGAIAAVASSRNQGSAFVAPIVPAMIVITIWSLHQIDPGKLYSTSLLTFTIIVSIVAGTPLFDLESSFARPRVVDLPILGQTTVTDGRSTIQRYEIAGGLGGKDAVEPIDRILGRAWVSLSAETAGRIEKTMSVDATVAFGFRNHIYNVNTVGLQQLLLSRRQSNFKQIAPTVTEDSIAGYHEWLTKGDASDTSLLLLTDGQIGEFFPLVNHAHMQQAAERSGFKLVDRWSMPNGQGVTMWKRTLNSNADSESSYPIDQK